jgi:class 3 adenylate cyclase
VQCPSCGHVNPDDALFCSECGNRLSVCPVCNAPLPEGARFCPNCGTALAESRGTAVERRLVTVLFADIADSTALGERLDPEDLHQAMAAYFDAMRGEIESQGGTVEKFIGDAVMAVFGVPVAHEDDSARALRAALAMVDRLVLVNTELLGRLGVELQIRVGINSGEVLTRLDALPGEPMVTGDVVNAAARLQATAEPGQILVAQRTARAVRGFIFDEATRFDLRGRSQPVQAMVLRGERAADVVRTPTHLSAPMVGRDYEMTLLRTMYRRAVAERHPDFVTIYGEPGVGKSRLTREFMDWAEDRDHPPTIMRGRCLPYGDGVTYWPLAEILKTFAGVKDEDSTAIALQKITEVGNQLLSDAEAVDPEETTATLAYTVGLEDRKYRVRERDPREARAVINNAWKLFFSALSLHSPVVVVIEDIHWADHALLDLLEFLAERVVGAVMFLCPARPGLAERRPGWSGGRRNMTAISLDPLSPEESESLVEALLAVDNLPAGITSQILDRAGGNPFFLEEIVESLIDNGMITKEGERWVASRDLAGFEVPDSIQAVLASRIDLLDPLDKRVLQRAAVVGRIFWPTPVERLLDMDEEELLASLERLEARDFARSQLRSTISGEPEYIFKHLLTREVAYESLPRAERGAAHALVGDWIAEAAGERASEFVEFQVYHYQQAYRAHHEDGTSDEELLESLRLKAFNATLAAGIGARRRFAVRRAFGLIEQALELAATPTERSKALRQKGRIANSDYAGDIAWEALKESADLTLAHPPADRREVARACAFAVETPTRWSGSMRTVVEADEINYYIDQGLAHLAEEDTGPERIRLLTARAFSFRSPGHGGTEGVSEEAAREAASSATEMALELERFDLASAALDALGSVDLQFGRYGQTLPIIEQRLKVAQLIKNPWEIGDIHAMAAWTYAYTVDYRRAAEIAMDGFEANQSETRGVRLHNLPWAAYADFFLGNWARVTDHILPTAIAILGERMGEIPYFASDLVGIRAMLSSTRETSTGTADIAVLRELVDVSEGKKVKPVAVWLAWILHRQGDTDGAWEIIESRSANAGLRPFSDIVEAHLRMEDPAKPGSLDFLASAREYAASALIRTLLPHLDRLDGVMASINGQHDEAVARLETAHEGFEELGTRWESARTDLELARVFRSMDRNEEARTRAASALTLFADLTSLRETRVANQLLSEL